MYQYRGGWLVQNRRSANIDAIAISSDSEEEDQMPLTPPTEPATMSYANELPSAIRKKKYLSDNLADFHFTFETGERIPAHKFVLAGSNVFETMFNGSWKEVEQVEIVDASADAFKEFLQFFYLNDVKLTMGNVAEVMNLGNKYSVAECLRVCGRFLEDSLTVGNVCSVLDLALFFNQHTLKVLCEEIITADTVTILKAVDFLECEKRALGHILGRNVLDCTEVELFEAVMSWVNAKSKQKQLTKGIIQAELGDLFYRFRFRSMTFEQFVSLLPAYGHLFTREEQQDILQMIASGDYEPRYFDANIRTYEE